MGNDELNKIFKYIDDHFEEDVEEYRRFMRQPSVSPTGEGVQECAELTCKYYESFGAEAEVVQLRGGHPIAYGRLMSNNPDAKTLLIYQAYDTVGVKPEKWTFPPFEARIVDAEEIKLPPKIGKVIVARGAWDKKCCVVSALMGVKSVVEVTGDVPVNLLLVMEGEEEIGSPHLPQFRDRYIDDLKKVDACYNPMWQRVGNRHYILCGVKGVVSFSLRIRGGMWGGPSERDIWDGENVFVESPLRRLVQALNTLHDENYNVRVEDFYENFRQPTEEELEMTRKVAQTLDKKEMMQLLGAKKFKEGSWEDQVIKYTLNPLLNIDMVHSGYPTEEGFRISLPKEAIAGIAVRLVPEMTCDEVLPKLRRHFDRHGFKEIEIKKTACIEWSRTPLHEDIIQAAIQTTEMLGVEPIPVPTMAAANNMWVFNKPPLSIPYGHFGLGPKTSYAESGNRVHSQDEYIAINGIPDAEKFDAALLYTYANM